MAYIYVLGTAVFTIYGQLILKWRLGKYGPIPEGGMEKVQYLLTVLVDPIVLSGLVSAFVASVFWIGAASTANLSVIYPLLQGGMLLAVSFLAIVLLREPLTIQSASGIVCVCLGIFLVTYK